MESTESKDDVVELTSWRYSGDSAGLASKIVGGCGEWPRTRSSERDSYDCSSKVFLGCSMLEFKRACPFYGTDPCLMYWCRASAFRRRKGSFG